VAAWLSIFCASGVAALQLGISGTVPLDKALPAMLGVHALIGVGEAVITAAVITTVALARPDLLPGLKKAEGVPA
jgi:cobalt/nickel transport system permease protein